MWGSSQWGDEPSWTTCERGQAKYFGLKWSIFFKSLKLNFCYLFGTFNVWVKGGLKIIGRVVKGANEIGSVIRGEQTKLGPNSMLFYFMKNKKLSFEMGHISKKFSIHSLIHSFIYFDHIFSAKIRN